MPFTPFHMGPGILVKAALRGAFSLIIFGGTQVLMDVQPLVVILTRQGHMHGITHTYLGATIIAAVAAVAGKRIIDLGMRLIEYAPRLRISWVVAISSALIGGWSHVLLDSVMHADVRPFYPFSASNGLHGAIFSSALHGLCFWTGAVGAGGWLLGTLYLAWRQSRRLGDAVAAEKNP